MKKTVALLVCLSIAAVFAFSQSREQEIYTGVVADSKEYKVSLNAELFGGKKDKEKVEALRIMLRELTNPDYITKDYEGKGYDDEDSALISFYDVPAKATIWNSKYILRNRFYYDSGENELTLKYRSGDLEESGLIDINRGLGDPGDLDTKFEEDTSWASIKYSKSTSLITDPDLVIAKGADAIAVFPLLADVIESDTPLEKVGGLEVHAYVYPLFKYRFDDRYDEEDEETKDFAKISIRTIELELWYVNDDDPHPVVAELSWKIKTKERTFNQDNLARSNAIYAQLQKNETWVNPDPETKTTMMYMKNPEFFNSAAAFDSKGQVDILSFSETIRIRERGEAEVSTRILFPTEIWETVLVPFNYRDGYDITPADRVELVSHGSAYYLSLRMSGEREIRFTHKVKDFQDWRVGVYPDGTDNTAVKDYGGRSVRYEFVNYSTHIINNYMARFILPEGFRVNNIQRIYPAIRDIGGLERYTITDEGLQLGYKPAEALYEEQLVKLSTGSYIFLDFTMKEAAKPVPIIILLGLLLAVLWLIGFKDLLTAKKNKDKG